tara:strand:+ start:72 stop:668 length:597 start_codon:yes stop_codon:yes gene_type:complete
MNKRKNTEGESSDSKKQKTELTRKEKMVKILTPYREYRPYRMDSLYVWRHYNLSLEDVKEFMEQNRQVRIYAVLDTSFYEIKVSAVVVDDKVFYHTFKLEYRGKIYFPVLTHGKMLKKWIDKTLKALYDPNIFLLAQKQEKIENLFTIKGHRHEEATLEMEPLSKHTCGIEDEIDKIILQAKKFVWNQAKKVEIKKEK